MAKIPYETAPGNPFTAPKGKVPYIKVDGKLMGDSTLIIDYLKQTNDLDKGLSEKERAEGLALQRLVEEHLYFATAWLRWNDETSLKFVREYFLSILPPVIGGFIFKKLHKDFNKAIRGQGMGRHSREEIIQFAKEDLKAVSLLLGDKPFIMGENPTSFDAMLFGFLIQLLGVPWTSPVIEYAKSLPNLPSYCDRMKLRYWANP